MGVARTCLWFDGDGEEAARFYVSLLPNSEVERVLRHEDGSALLTEFSLDGAPYAALDGGPTHRLSPAASIAVRVADQSENDRLWEALIADGGEESQCGWLTDRFGLSWQIQPVEALEMVGSDQRVAASRAMAALMKMKRIDVAAMRAAFEGR